MFLTTAVETETEGEEQRVYMRGVPQGGILGHTLCNVDDLKARIKYPICGYVNGNFTATMLEHRHLLCEYIYILLMQSKQSHLFHCFFVI